MAFRRGYTHETAAVFVYFPREEEEATRGEKRGSIVDDDNRGNPLISQTRSRIPFASERREFLRSDVFTRFKSYGKWKKFRFEEEGRWGVDSMMSFGKKGKGRE